MKIWLVRFVPLQGGILSQALFRDEDRARQVWKEALDAKAKRYVITDDFGTTIAVDPHETILVLTNTEISAASEAALATANNAARRSHGLALGSTMQ